MLLTNFMFPEFNSLLFLPGGINLSTVIELFNPINTIILISSISILLLPFIIFSNAERFVRGIFTGAGIGIGKLVVFALASSSSSSSSSNTSGDSTPNSGNTVLQIMVVVQILAVLPIVEVQNLVVLQVVEVV
jgi:hypothetical protein